MAIVKNDGVMYAGREIDFPNPFSNTLGDENIPERFVNSSSEQSKWRLFGDDTRPIKVSSGFNEDDSHHSRKSSSYYIDRNNQDPTNPSVKPSGRYNIGIDYVVEGDKQVTPWYSGTVERRGWDGGYGNSITIKTDHSYDFNGKKYPIYNTYSHLKSFGEGTEPGQHIRSSDTFIGVMGKTGGGYDEHVDFQTYIMVDGKRVNLSPNLMQDNLSEQAERGTFQFKTAGVVNQSNPIASLPSIDGISQLSSFSVQQMVAERDALNKELYDLADSLTPGDSKSITKTLSQWGGDGKEAFASNDPNAKMLTGKDRDSYVDKAFSEVAMSKDAGIGGIG
jgi:murein DD-endopeptidase MepM/ murein hydrolase activator NlpD